MREVVKRNVEKAFTATPDEMEFFDMTIDQQHAAVNEMMDDWEYTIIREIADAEDVETLFKSDTVSRMIASFKWASEWYPITWDELAGLLDNLKNAVIERISAEQ